MGKYFDSGTSGNAWILKALLGSMGVPSPASGSEIVTNALGQKVSMPTIDTLAGKNTGGSFLGNLGKNLWQQSPIGQTTNKTGNILSGNFTNSMSDLTEQSKILDIIKKLR